jgi:beta-fructofuranosidase
MEMRIRQRYSLSLLVGVGVFFAPAFLGTSSCAQDNQAPAAAPKITPQEIEKVEKLIGAANELRDRLQNDPQRPKYHFMPPWAWINDPNGPIFWKGRYHLFYQFNPNAGTWGLMHWGHASSKDLVHWTHHPIALRPTPGGPDRDGIFSGGAVINNGVPTLIYHGVPDGTCIATSEEDDLIHWKKCPQNPVIPVPKADQKVEYGVYDPCAWKQGDTWYALTGWGRNFARPNAPEGDTAFLFKSPDLVHWEYVHPFYQSDRRWTDADEDCAVPDFFPLGQKWALFFASHKRGCQYYLGRYENDHFYPEQHARLNWSGGQVIAPITMQDDRGRRILFTWINEARLEPSHRVGGWAGLMGLPRELTLPNDNLLRIEPVPEIESLRFNGRQRSEFTLEGNAEVDVGEMRGDCMELQLEMSPINAQQVGLLVRCSPDGTEQAAISYDGATKTLRVDGSKASLIAEEPPLVPILPPDERKIRTQSAPLILADGEPLKLRVFLDRSVVEVFVNGRQAVAQRIYPSRPDSLGTRVFSRGGRARVTRLQAWDMAAAGSF